MAKCSKVFFRADGNSNIGFGHIYRLLSIAEILKNHYECLLITKRLENPLRKRVLSVFSGIHEIELEASTENDLDIIERLSNRGDLIILDGYNFITEYQLALKSLGLKIISIDDIHSFHFVSDVVINHAGGIKENVYSISNETKLYLGVKYSILRESFRNMAKNRCQKPSNNIFICFGGSDPKNETLNTLKFLEQYNSGQTFHVVIGGGYLHGESLKSFLGQSKLNFELLNNLTTEEMIHYMNLCSVAVTAPSTISYEYLCSGGLLFLKQTAENQSNIFQYFIKECLAFPLIQFGQLNPSQKAFAMNKQKLLFDGDSGNRILEIVRSLTI